MNINILYLLSGIFWFLIVVIYSYDKFRAWFEEKFDLLSTSSGVHILELDTFRGAAAAFVALFHGWQWTYPFYSSSHVITPFILMRNKGVPIFAVLSGFLIYSGFHNNKISIEFLRKYFYRRFIRLYPLFFVVATTVILMGQGRSDPTIFHGILSDMLMMQVWGFPYMNVLPAWSLYVEIIFYCFLPILFIVFNGRIMLVSIIILVVSLVVGHSADREFQLIPFFCGGVISYMLYLHIGEVNFYKRHLATVLFFLGFSLFVLDVNEIYLVSWAFESVGSVFFGENMFPFNTDRSPDLLLSLLLMVSSVKYSYFTGVFRVSFLRFIGVISYSLYLWHTIIIIAVFPVYTDGFNNLKIGVTDMAAYDYSLFLIYFPSVLLVSAVSYYFIERPFLKRRHLL